MNSKSAPMIFGVAVLAGCASPSPNVDKHYGEAVSTARVAQTFMVHPPYAPEALTGMDGKAAKEAVGRYFDSFKAPPPTINVINIGGGLGGQ